MWLFGFFLLKSSATVCFFPPTVGTMAVDWIGFAYAALLAVGGVVGYTRKGSKISLAAGLTFGSMAGYGAYCVTRDPRNVKISLFSAFLLTVIMGMRFKRSKKLMPAGLVACLRQIHKLRTAFLSKERRCLQ
uniref:Transmembrane protein 14A n=1 Tax=Phasianus colchicus TaxID=9054 RepID=A0A669QNJ8_PHACC